MSEKTGYTPRHKKYYQKNKQRILEKQKEYKRQHREIYRKSNKKYYRKNKEKINQRSKRRHQRQKLKVLIAYSKGKPPYCACCGEKNIVFLTIDHIDDCGKKRQSNLYIWLIKNNFPEGFQVLCRNCNWAKSHGGCPHKEL